MSAGQVINTGILLHGAWDVSCRIACHNQYRFQEGLTTKISKALKYINTQDSQLLAKPVSCGES